MPLKGVIRPADGKLLWIFSKQMIIRKWQAGQSEAIVITPWILVVRMHGVGRAERSPAYVTSLMLRSLNDH